MFFVISKVLAFLTSPLTWILILLGASLIYKKSKVKKRLLISTMVLFVFFTNPVIIDEILRLWETPVTNQINENTYDAGIVLGGGMVVIDKDNDRLIFRENTDRFLQALDLYKKGIIRKIIISGGSGSIVFKETLEGALMNRYLTGIGIPQQDLLIDSSSNNTYENAVNCAKIVRDSFPDGDFLLITSAYHMRRAKACFDKQQLTTSVYTVGKFTGKRRHDIGYYLKPDTDALVKWEKFIHELIGYITYKIMGYA